MNRLTFVTGLWNIGRDSLNEGWSRSFQHYLEKFGQLLNCETNMIIFGEEEIEDFVWSIRSKENTQFIIRNKEWFKNSDNYEKIQNIRLNPNFFNSIACS